MALGVAMYTQDYDETIVYSMYGSESRLDCPAWPGLIYSYVKSDSIYNCPSATIKIVFDWWPEAVKNSLRRSYCANADTLAWVEKTHWLDAGNLDDDPYNRPRYNGKLRR